ncbi:MAG: outer membrane protein transport protein [Hyphomicrobiales bacterium]|nr:outer membrane protein transport protein [Hyphomicrobiales bacterium]
MNNILRGVILSTAAVGISAAAISPVVAGGFAIREQSAQGMGLSFAGAAAGGAGLGSMFWNPAIMTQYHGWQAQKNLTLIIPNANVRLNNTVPALPFANSSGTITQAAVAPATYASYQINDRFWAGIAVNSRFGLVTKYPFNGNWQTGARSSKVFSVSFNPNIAYKVNEFLSVAVGVNVEYFKVRLTGATGPAPNAPSVIMEGDSWALGYTLGATIKPTPGTTLGIGYRSEIRPRLSGSVIGIAPAANGIRSNIVLPQQVTIGLRQEITPAFTLLAGVEWTNWKVFNSFPVISTGPFVPAGVALPGALGALSFRWQDGWMASVGGEYKWDNKLTLRSGIGYEWSPVTSTTRGLRLPDANRLWVSAGFSYKWSERVTIDASYTHLFIPTAQINVTATNPTFTGVQMFGRARAHFDLISVGLNYRFDTPVRSVVAKY